MNDGFQIKGWNAWESFSKEFFANAENELLGYDIISV